MNIFMHAQMGVCFKKKPYLMCNNVQIVALVDLLKGLQEILVKVLWHFPLIPWLLCMYKCKSLAKLLTWHKDGASSNGLIWCVPNSTSWKHINDKWPNFANDSQNVKLGLALNKVNPFGDLSSTIPHGLWFY
jgi:hypothetical protein